MDTLWDPLTALFAVVGEGFEVVFAMMASLASIFALSTGLVTLFFGRKMFWVFIGAAGFILGLNVAPPILALLPDALAPLEWLFMLAIALLVGGLSIVLQRIASVVAGGLLIGMLAFLVAGSYELGEVAQWIAAVACGVAGAFLLYFMFDWTLIIVSALVGAVVSLLGVRAFAEMPEAVHLWGFVILAVMGAWYQARDMRGEAARARAAAAGKVPATPARPTQSSGASPAAAVAPAAAPASGAASAATAPGAWPAAVQRPATPRPPAESPAFQTSPQAWG
jgi:hypothetical protein